MNASLLYSLIRKGNKPLVKITEYLWDESFGDKGMIARAISAVDRPDNLIEIKFDYNEHREHNISLDQPNWWIGSTGKKGTAIEANHFLNPNNIQEEVLFEHNQDINIELIDNSPLLSQYIEYASKGFKGTYSEWLEKYIITLEKHLEEERILYHMPEIPIETNPSNIKEDIQSEADLKKYTAIYVEPFMSGSHMQSVTSFKRIEQKKNETVLDMLKRENIAAQTRYIFEGWARLEGEENYPNIPNLEGK
jgi:hypothetical protein